MKKSIYTVFLTFLFIGSIIVLSACLSPINFDPNQGFQIDITGQINTTDVTAAVLMLTNRTKTVDVTNVSITQPGWLPPVGNYNAQPPSISYANHPKRLEKKAQYLTPSDKSYRVVINYTYEALHNTPAGTGTQTLLIPLPLPREIVEYVIYRNDRGDVIIDREAKNPDPGDTGNPAVDPLPGEGSSPAVIPPEARNRMGTFIVVSKTNSQVIDSVNLKMGNSDYTMGMIGANDKQSIALGQGSWETTLKYTRSYVDKYLGPINSIIVPSNDPQAFQEHYLYFYLNKRGNYAISPTWPPFPNDVDEEDILPLDAGFGRGVVKIINNSQAIAEAITIHNLRDDSKFPWTIDYVDFSPPIPIQYNRTGYVDVVGTAKFPIEGHDGYLIQIYMEDSNGFTIVERRAYIKDQVVTIVIDANDLQLNNSRGSKFILENKTNDWPMEIIGLTVHNKANAYQSSYYGNTTWTPNGDIGINKSAVQYVMSSTAMPIIPGAEFEASVLIHGFGVSTSINKVISPAVLYSNSSPDQNSRTITITDADVPDSIKSANRIGAKVTIVNNTNNSPVQITGMTVRNINNHNQNTYYGSSTWEPKVFIDSQKNAVQMVMNSTDMPITSGAQYEAVLFLSANGKTDEIIMPFTPTSELFSSTNIPGRNLRTVTISDGDVPASLKPQIPGSVGATVTIENKTNNKPVQIIGMIVRNKANYNQKTGYGITSWSPNGMIEKGKNANQLVLDSTAMPITAADQFEALITILGNDKTAEVKIDFAPNAVLFSSTPQSNLRTITIVDSNVPPELVKPVNPPITIPDIGGAKEGDTIVIDGIDWIKVRPDLNNPALVLLMLKGVTGSTVKYDANGRALEYTNNPSIKAHVDNWYKNLNSPTLKMIAWQVIMGKSPQKTSPGTSLAGETNYNGVAFIPRLTDIDNLSMAKRANRYRFWNSDIYIHHWVSYYGYVDSVGIVESDGYGGNATFPNYQYIYARPCIWVKAK